MAGQKEVREGYMGVAGQKGWGSQRYRTRTGCLCRAHLLRVNAEFLEGIDGNENVTHIRVDLLLLVPLPQLRHYHTLDTAKKHGTSSKTLSHYVISMSTGDK